MSEKPQEQKSPGQLGAQLGDRFKKFQEKLAKEPMPEMLNRPELQNRAMAVLIDLVIAVVFFFVVAIGGNLVAGGTAAQIVQGSAAAITGTFLLLKDGFGGRSPGKRLVGLKVVRTSGVGPVDPVTSAMRNWPLASMFVGPMIGSFLAAVPFSGLLAVVTLIAAGAVQLYEVYRVLMDKKDGLRLGDVMAKTRVVEE